MQQLALFSRGISDDVRDAQHAFAVSSPESRGAIYTRPEVVNFMLCLCGFASRRRPTRVLEPSFGGGDFLLPVIDRLLSLTENVREVDRVALLRDRIVAIELSDRSFQTVRDLTGDRLNAACNSLSKVDHSPISVLTAGPRTSMADRFDNLSHPVFTSDISSTCTIPTHSRSTWSPTQRSQ